MKQKRARGANQGFTLIELIIVVVILCILAAAAIPSLIGFVHKAQEGPAISECSAVVTATQAKLVGFYAASTDSNTLRTAANKAEILHNAGVGGKILRMRANKDYTLEYLSYQCPNGLIVVYDITVAGKYTVVREASSPNTVLNAWQADMKDFTQSYGEDKGRDDIDRKPIIEAVVKQYGLLDVEDSYIEDTPFEKEKGNLYWRPYYVGTTRNPQQFLFANSGNGEGGNAHAGWSAKLVYINDNVYVSTAIDGKGNPAGISIAQIYNNSKTLEEAEAYLLRIGFVLKED